MANVDLSDKEISILMDYWKRELKASRQVKRITTCAQRIEKLREALGEEMQKPPELRVIKS